MGRKVIEWMSNDARMYYLRFVLFARSQDLLGGLYQTWKDA